MNLPSQNQKNTIFSFLSTHFKWGAIYVIIPLSSVNLSILVAPKSILLNQVYSMGISVSESAAQRYRMEQLKKGKGNTNSEIHSENKKPFENIQEDRPITRVTNTRKSKNDQPQQVIQGGKIVDKDRHSSQKVKSIKVGSSKESHLDAIKSARHNKAQQIASIQQAQASKLNSNEPVKMFSKVSPPKSEKRVSFVQSQSNVKQNVENSHYVEKDMSKSSLKSNQQQAKIISSEDNEQGQKAKPFDQSPINSYYRESGLKMKKKVQQNDEAIYTPNWQPQNSRMTGNASKTLNLSKNPLRLDDQPQLEKTDIVFEDFDWKIPKSTINKVVPTYKRLKPQASVVLINKLGQQEEDKKESVKKSNWKNRRELMKQIVSGRLDRAEPGFSLDQCMPLLKENDIYKQTCS